MDSTFVDSNRQSYSLPLSIASTACVLFGHLAAALITVVVCVIPLGYFLRVCEDMDLGLPPVTELTLNLHYWLTRYWYLLGPLLFIDVLGYFMLARRPAYHWLAVLWAVVPLVVAIALLGLIVIGVCMPLDQLLEPSGPRIQKL